MNNQRQSRDILVQELKLAGARFRGQSVYCPFHDDRNPSGSVYRAQDGVWRYKCQSVSCAFCGDIYDVRANVTGKSIGQVLPKSIQPASMTKRVYKTIEQIEASLSGEVESKFIYSNPDTGRHDLIVLRYTVNGKKAFRQIHGIDGGYVIGAPAKPWPLYNRSRIRDANIVIVVEGEKCVHALHDANMVATTSPAGAGKASHADWQPLAGKMVILWPDNDQSGNTHMQEVRGILESLEPAPQIYWLDPDALGLGEKEDAADYLAKFTSKTAKAGAVMKMIDLTEECSIAADLEQFTEDIISGNYVPVDWPWPDIGELTRALLPGTVTLLCGDPGSTKSFLLLQAAAHWYENGVKVALYELEEDRQYHLYRALVQRVAQSRLFDHEWVKQHPDFVRQARQDNRDFINGFGRCIAQAPDSQTTLEQLADWVEVKAKAGCRVIAIDPVTAAVSEEKPWIADNKFVMKVKTIVRQYRASLILVTHPKKGRKQAVGLDELAGGAAYARFAQTVLWLEAYKQLKDVVVETCCGRTGHQINRSLRICKTRNGQGHGASIGYVFNGKSLTFEEKGVIVPQ